MVERAFLLGMKRHHDGEDRVAVLDRSDPAGRIALAVAQPLDLVDDRNLGVAGQDEVAMQRMRQPPFDGAARRHHGLSDHLAAEHPLPTRLRAAAAKQVHLDRLQIENGNQVNQAFGHGSALVNLGHSGMVRRTRPRGACTRESRDSGFDTTCRLGMTMMTVKYLVSGPCFAQLLSGSKSGLM